MKLHSRMAHSTNFSRICNEWSQLVVSRLSNATIRKNVLKRKQKTFKKMENQDEINFIAVIENLEDLEIAIHNRIRTMYRKTDPLSS